MRHILKHLQNRPYHEKIRILKIAAFIAALLMVAVWIITLKFREVETGNASKFKKIWSNILELKSKL